MLVHVNICMCVPVCVFMCLYVCRYLGISEFIHTHQRLQGTSTLIDIEIVGREENYRIFLIKENLFIKLYGHPSSSQPSTLLPREEVDRSTVC